QDRRRGRLVGRPPGQGHEAQDGVRGRRAVRAGPDVQPPTLTLDRGGTPMSLLAAGLTAVLAATAPSPAPSPSTAPRGTGTVVIRGGTLLTLGPQGTIDNGTLVIRDGRIAAVGRDLPVPSGARVVEAAGRWVMPGIVDAHSHTAVEESVNECTDA